MTVALTMIARDEAAVIGRAIGSAVGLVNKVFVLDTGSTDNTVEIAESMGAVVHHAQWEGFAAARTAALELASECDWALMVDADETVEFHPRMHSWLETDPDPEVSAWQVEMRDGDLSYRLPRLTRKWVGEYKGVTHEWLEVTGKQRPLLGLTIKHHADGANRATKHERDIQLLADGVRDEDPRSVYYTAQALWGLGRTLDAVLMYELRAGMAGTWEEERWHAQYMAARLREDVPALLKAHADRPFRHEPLSHAARLTAARGHSDVLFVETAETCERMPPCQ
jgi:glycosyltransferase involved in cell wall biosynthesis